MNFLTTKNTTLKLHDPKKFQFLEFYLVQFKGSTIITKEVHVRIAKNGHEPL